MASKTKQPSLEGVVDRPVQAVNEPILCSPYEEPSAYWNYKGNVPYRVVGRRPASYWYTTKKTGVAQELFAEDPFDDLPLPNRLRDDVRRWRQSGYRGATEVTKDLFKYWSRADRNRRLFFCQLEAVETVIYLLEVRIPGRSSRTGFHNFALSDNELEKLLRGENPGFKGAKDPEFFPKLIDVTADPAQLGLRRLGCKMATGSGKTLVMAMLIAWAFCNRGRNPSSTEFPSAVLVCCPNLTVKNRLEVLKPEAADNYYRLFDLVPTRYFEYLNAGRVLVTNWHVFGAKSPSSEGGVTYRVVDKGEEDDRAFTLARLGDMAQRLPILVLNDEGHHCWRPKPAAEAIVIEGSREEKERIEKEREEARVWLDGLDRINNCDLLGPGRASILAAIDLSATPFFLGASGHIEGSPFPWLVSDFGLVDAIESGIVKIPRLPVVEEGGTVKHDEAGRPDPKYFRLWHHITESLKAGDKSGRRIKPEAIYREAEGALITLASQWKQRFDQFREATSTQQSIPPAMIVVCNETDTAQIFFEKISGEREDEVPGLNGKSEVRTVYGASAIFSELQNEPGIRRTIRIDSKMLSALQSDDESNRDEKVAETRRIIGTIGKAGMPGEHVRCVVSVSMLTEGWDANNVTQILGVRAFGSQLLCEQVVGRGLRRRSYEPDSKTGMLKPEHVDVYGIPFTLIPFKGRPPDEKAPEDRPSNHVYPVKGREELEIRAPRVESFVYEVGLDVIECDVSKVAGYVVKDDPNRALVEEVRGYRDLLDSDDGAMVLREPQDREAYYERVHPQAIHFEITKEIVDRLVGGATEGAEGRPEFRLKAKHLLFPQVLRIVQNYISQRVTYAPGTNPRDISFTKHKDRVVGLLCDAIRTRSGSKDAKLLPVINRMRRFHTTADAEETTTRPVVAVERSHLNAVILRSDLEREAAERLDRSLHVVSFAANSRGFGMTIPYADGDSARDYEPDFIAKLQGGTHLLLEIKGLKGELHDPNLVSLKNEAAQKWVAAVSNAARFGKWVFEICRTMAELDEVLARHATPLNGLMAFRLATPTDGQKYKSCVPLLQLKAIASRPSDSTALPPSLFDAVEWVEVGTDQRLAAGMFVAQLRGRSMEPTYPDGSWCLFGPARGGSYEDRILLVEHHDISDPAYAGCYTVRRYRSKKVVDPATGVARHLEVQLEPLNGTFPTLEIRVAVESEIRVIAELIDVCNVR